jgi:hypothetical protein
MAQALRSFASAVERETNEVEKPMRIQTVRLGTFEVDDKIPSISLRE